MIPLRSRLLLLLLNYFPLALAAGVLFLVVGALFARSRAARG